MILAQYSNGNCGITLHYDGTKVREWPDGSTPTPEFPESIDMKITNTCDMGCAWCHESATKAQNHAPVSRILDAVAGLPAGVEVAIGGGNPLDHPLLDEILQGFADRGLVSNMTVHGDHAIRDDGWRLRRLQESSLLHGAGISKPKAYRTLLNDGALPANSVCHAIVGVDDPLDVVRLKGSAVLVLGYKTYGRGGKYRNGEVANLPRWRYFVGAMLREPGYTLSFDNLALEQLGVRDMVGESAWARHYMGGDGEFTMYFDAVADQYAMSSTSGRVPANGMTIPDMFRVIQAV